MRIVKLNAIIDNFLTIVFDYVVSDEDYRVWTLKPKDLYYYLVLLKVVVVLYVMDHGVDNNTLDISNLWCF